MSPFYRVMYSPEDSSGGSGGTKPPGAPSAASTAALGIAKTMEERKALLDSYEEEKKLKAEIALAEASSNTELVANLQIRLQAERQASDISREQLDLLEESIERIKERGKAEAATAAQTEAIADLEANLAAKRHAMGEKFLAQLGSIHNLAAKVSQQTGLVNKFNEIFYGSF